MSESLDKEYAELRARLVPLNERLTKMGYHFGLHLTTHPKRYEAFYGHTFLFHAENPGLVAEKLAAFVESTESRRAGYHTPSDPKSG